MIRTAIFWRSSPVRTAAVARRRPGVTRCSHEQRDRHFVSGRREKTEASCISGITKLLPIVQNVQAVQSLRSVQIVESTGDDFKHFHSSAVICLLPPQPMERRPMDLHARRSLPRARRPLFTNSAGMGMSTKRASAVIELSSPSIEFDVTYQRSAALGVLPRPLQTGGLAQRCLCLRRVLNTVWTILDALGDLVILWQQIFEFRLAS